MKYKITALDRIVYTGVILLSGIIASVIGRYIAVMILSAILNILPSVNKLLWNTFGFAFTLIVPIICTEVCLYFYLSKILPQKYFPSEDPHVYQKMMLILSLPGEITRFLICLPTLGFINSTGIFNPTPTDLFDQLWIKMTGRYEAVRQDVDYILLDYVGYSLCYILYFAVHMIFLMLIFKHIWNKAKTEYENTQLMYHTDR